VSTIIIKPSQLAIICLSFAEYVAEAFTHECAPSSDILKVIGITTVGEIHSSDRLNSQSRLLSVVVCLLYSLVVVTLINCMSVKLATLVQNVFTFCKMLAILLIICGGAYRLFAGEKYTSLSIANAIKAVIIVNIFLMLRHRQQCVRPRERRTPQSWKHRTGKKKKCKSFFLLRVTNIFYVTKVSFIIFRLSTAACGPTMAGTT
jgi:preprotein translocase subunit SecY